LQGRLNTTLTGLETKRRTTTLRRVRLNRAGLLHTLGGIDRAESGALEVFPPVLGRAYAQTFVPMDCVDSDLAIAQTAAQDLTQGRLARGKSYSSGLLASRLNGGKGCAGELRRPLGHTIAEPQARTLQRIVADLALMAGRPGGISAGAVRRGAASVTQSVSAVARRFPSVFGLRYVATFSQLDRIDTALFQAAAVVRQYGQGRLVPLDHNPAAYPFTFVLASIRTADGCAKTLGGELASASVSTSGGTSTAPAGTPGPGPGQGPGPTNPAAATTPIYLDTHYSFAERAADLVSRMTLAEKVAQLRTNSAPAIPRLGVQQYTYWSEGQHGVNALGANTDNGGAGGGPHATSFPTNFAAALTSATTGRPRGGRPTEETKPRSGPTAAPARP
jgi:hypothetical protein